MRKLTVFNFMTLNGYFKGANEDITWHRHGQEESEYAAEGAKSESIILFGRKTYEMMASYWPTPMAMQNAPGVAKGMNKSEKIVFSTTLKKTDWQNTRLIKTDIIGEVKKLKKTSGKDMVVLGSGSIVTQFAQAGIIDNYQFMIDPVALDDGATIFKGITTKLDLKLTDTKIFKSGVVLLCYRPL
ncbi:dihydrofolate reductase family protein [Chryseolinea sp. H1M3-3]|uniref:dihydrofolate reductase family protein n=1 Tax=Chryseolinea sp. H1M3-3 TaxID=3034144 RepID=UPI0023EB4610|nr:dihydrofolate reductase family protein [Chryseolinea sp. H1M3-3]